MCTWNCWLPTFAAAPRVIQCSVPQGRLLSTSVFFLGVFFSWLQDLWCSTGGQVTRDSSALFTNTSGWDLTNWTGRNRASWKNHPRWEGKKPQSLSFEIWLGCPCLQCCWEACKRQWEGKGPCTAPSTDGISKADLPMRIKKLFQILCSAKFNCSGCKTVK